MKIILLLFLILGMSAQSQVLNHKNNFSRQDSLRGSNTEFRNWWNVLHYDVEVQPDFNKKSIKGKNTIQFQITKNSTSQILQIDLQQPMQLDAAFIDGAAVKSMKRDGNVYFLTFNKNLENQSIHELNLQFSGQPKIAVRPPWDGGWIFVKDEEGRPWMSVACQGLGASVWFPNKDYQGDEPENGANLSMIVDKDLVGVSNGRLVSQKEVDGKMLYKWEVKNPINNYNLIPYIGHYSEIKDHFQGEKGKLDLNYWVLDYNVEKARKQFTQTKTMLKSFEYWFGPYPFYEDSFKLIESPHLGMEHQSGIAYGNLYENGYLGTDISESGWGLKWDFILIHESGHEWFGNNITSNDVADMWIHESFTSYSETLYTQDLFGIEAGNDYVIGTRKKIQNDIPLIGFYGVNQEGSGDMYYKGANMVHTFRQLVNDDEKFRQILRGMSKEFYHQTVDSKQIEDFMAQRSGLDLNAFFNQYLRTTKVPILEYSIEGKKLKYRWTNVVDGFKMPVKIANSQLWLQPTAQWKTESLDKSLLKDFKIDRNFYIKTKQIN